MATKYQIFISSTYEDLREPRDQVIRATLEMGHIPIGMEMFSAADEEQWKQITRHIDESDYYVVIVANRYGSTVNGVSYTEKEYNYAVQQGIPSIAFLLDGAALWPSESSETDADKREALEQFKEKLRQKPIGTWKSSDDLYGRFAVALVKLINTHPRPGWVRGSDMPSPDVLNELSRLSKENANLRDSEEIRAKKLAELGAEKITIPISIVGESEPFKCETSLCDLFMLLAPELAVENSVMSAATLIWNVFAPKGSKVTPQDPLRHTYVRQALMNLSTYDLVEPSKRKHTVYDDNEYWTLTVEGRAVYTTRRREPSGEKSTGSKAAGELKGGT